MEKPRKKEVIQPTYKESWHNEGWNACHDAMSTWLEGEVPTVESIADVLISKHCYVNFNSDTDQFVSIPIKKCSEAIHDLITRKLTGKV